ncbi:MAG: DUF2207 domain-containing protein [Leptospiraceae bacterium]|nr:DUF2207 domain-containing protein [Leptospiraceae bacterium]
MNNKFPMPSDINFGGFRNKNSHKRKLLPFTFLFLSLFINSSIYSQSKTLDWNSIQVDATLKNNGNLKVSETQSILFNGDWNGAYRKFDLGLGQKIHFQSLEIFRADGKWETLSNNSIDNVDSYLWYPLESMVKWRSRNPFDPVFDQKVITYRLNYEYEYILNSLSNSEFQLDHDFGFSDRIGNINAFTVNLSWEDNWDLYQGSDQAWSKDLNQQSALTIHASRALAPGEKMIVKVRFNYKADEALLNQRSVWKEYAVRILHFFLLTILALCLSALIYLYCKKRGFFAEPIGIKTWKEFESFLTDLSPEEVAILSEKGLVASWMTRLIQEKKLEFSTKEKEEKILRRLVNLELFREEDQTILKALFVENKDTISISELKSHYKKEKKSYSLNDSIYLQYSASLVKKNLLPNPNSMVSKIINFLFEKIITKFYIMIPLSIIIFIFHWLFIDPIMNTNGISTGRFAFFCFAIAFSRILMSLLVDDHYGFFDLRHNRVRYFLYRYLLSIVPSFVIFAFFFWSLDIHLELYYALLGICVLSIFEYLLNTNPIQHLQQIEITLKALALKEFLQSKLLSDETCDLPQKFAAYIPALDLTHSVEYRITSLGKLDCLYLIPEYFENWKAIIEKQKTASSSLRSGSSFGSSSSETSTSSMSTGAIATSIGLGGLFAGAGASASWTEMSNFSSSASYSPPSSSSSSGSSSSGGGGGGGW